MVDPEPEKKEVAAGADATKPAAQWQPVTVTLDGEQVTFKSEANLQEAVMLRRDWTKKCMSLADERKNLQRQASTRSAEPSDPWGRAPDDGRINTGDDSLAGPPGRGLSDLEEDDGRTVRTPTGRRTLEDDEDAAEVVTRAELRQAEERWKRRTADQLRQRERQSQWEREIDRMETSIPGFSRGTIEEEVARMRYAGDPALKEYLGMSKAAAYRLIYYDRVIQPQISKGPASASDAEETEEPPFAEGTRRTNVNEPTEIRPVISPDDRAGLIAAMRPKKVKGGK